MLVYFCGSSRDIVNDIHTYRKILKKVYALEHTVVNDWIEISLHRAGRFTHGDSSEVGWNINDIVRNSQAGIERAEVVICEASGGSTFGVGYEMAMALRQKKPVLCLVREEDEDNSYATGVEKNDLLTFRKYTLKNLDKIIESFLNDNTIKNKDLRFNFVMDRQIYNYIRSKSFKMGKTKAELVRELLLKDMEKD